MTYKPNSEFLRAMQERGYMADCTDLEGLDDALYLAGYREWNGSLWFVSGWLVLGAGAGLVVLARQRKWLELCFALAFSGQLGVVLTYYWVSQRFAAELLPPGGREEESHWLDVPPPDMSARGLRRQG